MKKVFTAKLLMVLFFVFIGLGVNAQTLNNWVGPTTGGSWATAANWSLNAIPIAGHNATFNTGTTMIITGIPVTTNVAQLSVIGNTTVTLQGAGAGTALRVNGLANANNITVASGSTLTLGSTTTFTLQYLTTTTQRGDISGTLNVNANNTFATTVITTAPGVTVTGTIQNNGGAVTGSANSLTFAASSNYNHAMNGGAIPTATWNAASNCNVTGIVATAPTTFAGTFGNITWNCASQSVANAPFTAASTVAGNLTITTGTLGTGAFTIGIAKDLTNNGTLNTASGVLNINGTAAAQTISGTGVWTTGTTGRINSLTVNNTNGVTLNPTVALQTALALTAGTLTATNLTIGVPATNFTTTRTAGSLANVPAWGYTTGAYAITYNSGAIINTGNELPPAATPTNGVMTVAVANTNVTLQANANIGSLTTSFASNTFNLNGFTLGLSLANPINNTGVITANAAGSTLTFNGSVAQTFTLAGTYTGSLISNIVINNSFSTSGLTLGTTNINVGTLTVNASRFFTLGGFNINIKNDLTNSGTITSTAVGSTITMNGTIAQNINGAGVWTTGTAGRLLNLTINNSAGVTINSTFAVQTGLILTAGVLTSSTLTIGVPATAVGITRTAGSLANVPNWGYTTGAYSILYNGGTAINTGNELPPATTPTNGVLIASLLNTNVTLQANANIGTLTTNVASNATFNLNGFTLGLSLANPISNTGVITANALGSTIILNGTVAQSLVTNIGTYSGNLIDNIIINNTSAGGVSLGGQSATLGFNNVTINTSRLLNLNGATIRIAGVYTNTGTLTANSAGSTIVLNGTSAQNFAPFTSPGTYTGSAIGATATGGLIINNTSLGGVTLDNPVNVVTLTLTSGVLNCTSTNFITVTGTAAGSCNLGGPTSFVNGPLVRSFPSGLVAGSTYSFPVGKSAYNLFELISPTTTLATTIRVEVFDAAAGGTDGIAFSSLPTPNKHWQATVLSGALTASGTIRLGDAVNVPTASSVIGNSATLTGTYNPIGGSNLGNFISATSPAPVGLGFFKIGTEGCLGNNITTTTYTIGTTGADFTKITNAVAALNGALVCGNIIFELQPDYVGTSGETFPITINAANYSGGPWNVTFRPAAGVSSTLTTLGNPGSGVNFINLNGANRITFDGRAGGTGSTIAWLMRNTQTAATFTPTIQFTADASNNTLQYLQLESQNALTTSGTVLFTAGTTTGNDNNTISNCLFSNRGDATTTFPANHIYAVASTSGRENSNISITNNNFRNFYINGNTSSGITVDAYNTDYTITGNSFYQTATLTPTSSTTQQYGISVSGTGTGDINIANNFIGGNAPGATGTWTATASSTIDYRFCGIFLSNTVATPASLIDGNTIRNFTISSGSVFQTQAGVFSGIYSSNVGGTISNNIIGSTGAASNIGLTFTGASALGVVQGIFQDGNGVINITANTVGGISLANSTSNAIIYNLHGIRASTSSTGSTVTITGNTIGSTTVANSLTNATGNTYNSTGNIFTTGIFCDAGNTGSTTNISNNTIANLSYNAGGNGSTGSVQVVGIYRQFAPANTISNNTIYNLSSTSPYIGTNTSASVGGIVLLTTLASNHTVSQNTIHSLSNTTASAAVTVTGIALNTTTTANTVTRNLIHSLSLSSSSAAAVINGIVAVAGNSNYSNNMIRLGINAAGSSITTPYLINGINEVAGTNNYYFNSVYLGGSGVTTGANPTYAFFSNVSSGTRAIQNNIFWNARSNNTGTGKHYAIRYGSATGLTITNNDLFANGTGAVLGNIGGTDNTVLAALSTNSVSADPQFINPTGDNGIITPGTNDVDLHIQPSPTTTPIEATGINIPTITADFDNETRLSLTPEDIGADAGNFIPVDLTPPGITYTTILTQCNTIGAGTYTFSGVSITDPSGVNTTSGNRPRIYYKKSTDANDLTGWKFVEATGTTSPFTFNIDFSLLNAGSISGGDNIQYFVVAQDQAPTPNVGINLGTFAATPSSVDLQPAAFGITGSINSFTVAPCAGIVTVGTGQNYTSLTNVGGIFAAINATTLTGPLTVNITSDLTAELGTNALNQWTESGVGGYTVTFQSSGTARTISGSYNGAGATTNGLVRLNGADRVTFNGGTGSQRLLIINNSGSGGNNAAFALLNAAQNNTINNCSIACGTFGATTANGVVFIGASVAGGGNNNNTITNNDIDNLSTFPLNGIYADGTLAVGSNTGNTISSNNITDFYIVGGGSCGGITIATANTGFSITNNNIYQTANRISASPVDYYFIRIGVNTGTATTGVGFTISGNKLGGTGRDGSGNITGTWTESNSGTAHRFYGIMTNQSTTTGAATVIENNILSGFSFTTSSTGGITGSGGGAWNGIAVVAGNVNIGSVGNGNIIGSTTANSAIIIEKNSLNGPGNSAAIWVNGANTNVNTVGNTVAGIDITQTSSADPQNFYGIYYLANSASTKNITNNTIGTISTTGLIRCLTGADNQNLVGIFSSVNTGGLINISNNRIAGLNANGGSTGSGTGRTVGIEVSGGSSNYTISNNRIFNLTNQSFNNNALATPSVAGIRFAGGGTQATTISGNTIYALTHTTTVQNVSLTGIYFNGSSSTGNSIANNSIHSFEFTSTSNSASLFGIVTDGTSPATVSNNTVRLGFRPNAATVPSSTNISGIYDNATGVTNVYYNSVFIGGTSGSALTGNSFAYRRNAPSGADIIRNNIFANDRNGGSGSSLHLAFASNTLTGYTAANFDNNIFYSKNNTEFSIVATPTNLSAAATTALRLQAMRAQTPLGNNLRSGISTLAQINFINATGDSSAVDLRLNNINCASGAGIAVSTIGIDNYGNTRTTTAGAATDIGAHEGPSFSALSADNDIYTPNFSFANIPTQSACGGSSSTTVDVTITDIGTAVPTTGSNVPVMWWRRSAPTTTTWVPAQGVLQSGNGNNGVFRFTITNTYAIGETYQYYFVADDQATNQALSPAGINRWYSNYNATTPVVDLTTQTTQPATVSSFATNTATPLSGTVLVGTGQTYTTFGGVGGLFEAIQNNGLSGDLTALVTSNITDNNITSLSQWQEYCGSGYKLYIKPQTTGTKVISVTAANGFGFGFIKIQGADRVIIDGSFGGSGNFLTFRNLYASNANVAGCIYMDGTCQNDTLRNITIEGQGHHLQGGNLIINTSSASSIYVDKCIIKGVASNAVPNNLVYSATSGSGTYTITNCNLYDFSNFGSSSAGQLATALLVDGLLSPSATWTISNNSIYNTFIDGTSSQKAIRFAPGTGSNGNIISGNYIGGTAPLCTGTAMTNNTNSDFIMMEINVGSDVNNPTVISNNTIQNALAQSGDAGGITAMEIQGVSRVNITGNTIGHPTLVNSLQGTGGGLISGSNTGWCYGIYSSTSSPITISNNTIAGLASVGSYRSFVNCIELSGTGAATITGNTIANSYIGASTSGYNCYGIAFSATGNSNHLISNNSFTKLGSSNATVNGNYATAILFNGNNQGAIIELNTITDLFHIGNGGESNGIHIVGSNANYIIRNNQINMLNRSWLATYTTRKIFNGIHDWTTSGTVKIYNNTIYVQGSQTGTSGFDYASACYYRLPNGSGLVTGANVDIKNNVLVNSRTGNPTANSLHYVIDNTNTSNPTTGWSSNNNLMSNITSANFAFWGSANRTFAQWQTVSGGDANSQAPTVLTSGADNTTNGTLNPVDIFVSTTTPDLHIKTNSTAPYLPHQYVENTGTTLADVVADFDLTARPLGTGYDIGMDEFVSCSITSNTLVTTPFSVCINTTATINANPATSAPAASYQWLASTTSATTGYGNATGSSTSEDYTSGALTQTTWFRRLVTASACTDTSAAIQVTVDPLPVAAGTITGTATVCQGQTGITYTVPAITNATDYTWTLPTGGSITAGANTNSITVSYSNSATSGNVTVQGTNTCGNGTVSANFAVTVNPLPIAAGTITGTATVCQGQTGVTYTVPAITNATGYTWTLPTGGSITAGANTNSITVSFSNAATSGNVTVQGTNACGNGTVSTNFAVIVNACSTGFTWLGGTPGNLTDWNTGTNWSGGIVPTVSDDITIPNQTNDPVLAIGANGLCKSVAISSGATITIASGKTIDVKGNWTGVNNTVSGAGKLIFSGATAQTISGGATISNLQINNTSGVTVALGVDVVNVTTALELIAGTVTTNGNIKTISTALSTAYIDDFSSGFAGSLSGNVKVERYITNGPNGFRYIGAPVATTAGGSTLALSALSGFVISGTPGQLIPLATCNPNNSAGNSPYATFMRWEEAGPYLLSCRQSGWWFQTTGTMTIGRGYGAKLSGGNKITYTGAANTGNSPAYNCTSTPVFAPSLNGWNLVANPYPSNIRIDNTDGNANNNMPAGFDGQVQFYQTSGPYTGTYVTFNAGTTSPPILPIALGQGFWVKVTNTGSASWSVSNNHRITNTATYYDVNPNVAHHLKVDIAGNGFMDQTHINFKGDAQTGYDTYDANKWDGRQDQPTLYTKIGSEQASINTLPSLAETIVVPMGVKPGTNGNYTFTFEDIATFPQTSMIYLEDLQLGTMTDLRANNSYNFSMTINDDANRFMLHFQPGLQAEVADQDCDNAGSIELTQPAPTVWSTYEVRGNDNNVYAQGANLTGTVTFANLPAQEYVVTVTHSSGYTAQEYITVNGNSAVNATINASATNVMIDQPVTLTANATNATEYVWNFGDGNTQSGSSTVVHAYDAAGTYNVTVTASSNVCNDVANKTIVVGNTTGITGTQANTVNINGQGERVVIEFNNWGGNKADIFMYNALGQRMESLTGVSTLKGRQEFNIADIIPGTYFIQVVSDGKIQGKKVYLGKH